MAVTDNAATGGADLSEQPPNALIEATTALLNAVSELGLPLDLPTAEPARRARTEIEHILTAAILPRLRTPDAPLLCALAGPTGVGKSTLLNALAGATLSATGPLRPTTRTPVLVCHPADMSDSAGAQQAEPTPGYGYEAAPDGVATRALAEDIGAESDAEQVGDHAAGGELPIAGPDGESDAAADISGLANDAAARKLGEHDGESQAGELGEPSSERQAGDPGEPASETQAGESSKPTSDTQTGGSGGPAGETAASGSGEPASETQAGDSGEPAGETQAGESGEPASETAAGESSEPASETQAGELGEPASETAASGSSEPASESQAGDSGEPANKTAAGESSDPASETQAGELGEPAGTSQAGAGAGEPGPGPSASVDVPEPMAGPVPAEESGSADTEAAMPFGALVSAGQAGQRRGSGGPGLGARVGVELASLLSSPLPSPSLPSGIALVDTVDGDVAVVEAADVVVVVVSAERYADAAVWRVLRRVSGWGTPIVVVLGRVSAGVVEEVSGAFVELLRVNGLGAVPYFVVEEVGGVGDGGEGARARGALPGDSGALAMDGGQGESGAEDGGGAPGEGGYGNGGLGCAGEPAGEAGSEIGDGGGPGAASGSESGGAESDAAESGAAGSEGAESGAAESRAAGSEGAQSGAAESETVESDTVESEAAESGDVESESAEFESEVAESGDAESGAAESGAAVSEASAAEAGIEHRAESEGGTESESGVASESGNGSGAPLLPTTAVAGLHGWLKDAGADTAGRVRIGMLGVAGRLDSVDRLVGELADAWEGQRLALQVLHQGLERVHTAERVRFRGAVDAGELLGGEVRIRWQELLGSGRVSALFGAEDGAGRRRRRRKRAEADWSARFHNPTGHDVATAPLRAALVEAVARGHRGALERAARKTIDQWELTPGAPEPGQPDEATRRATDPARAAAEWLDQLPTVILDQAHSRRTTRTIGPAGAHIRSAALVLGVAALAGSGDITAAYEDAYEDAAAEAAVGLLHTMFGEDADRLRTTASTALKDANARLLDHACQPHRAQLAAYTLDPRQAQALADARAAVARARNEED